MNLKNCGFVTELDGKVHSVDSYLDESGKSD